MIDIFLGMPVMLNDVALYGMPLADANAAANMLNTLEVNRLGLEAN